MLAPKAAAVNLWPVAGTEQLVAGQGIRWEFVVLDQAGEISDHRWKHLLKGPEEPKRRQSQHLLHDWLLGKLEGAQCQPLRSEGTYPNNSHASERRMWAEAAQGKIRMLFFL